MRNSPNPERLASFVCGYTEFYRRVPVFSEGGCPWPLSRLEVYRDELVIHPRGLMAKFRTIHVPLSGVTVEEDRPFLWSSRLIYLRLFPDDQRGRITVTLGINVERQVRELLSSLGVVVRDKATAT